MDQGEDQMTFTEAFAVLMFFVGLATTLIAMGALVYFIVTCWPKD